VKWFVPTEEIHVGSIVIVVDSVLPRNCWPKGRITGTYPGPDGKVRVVDVKTNLGTFRRPITKISLLDVG